jgi:hypothetical protein
MHAEMDPYPFPVPGYWFDQRNEMFKRRTWDEEFGPHGKRLYTQVKYDDRYGYRKTMPFGMPPAESAGRFASRRTCL